jgi:hypothetical protein
MDEIKLRFANAREIPPDRVAGPGPEREIVGKEDEAIERMISPQRPPKLAVDFGRA